MYIRVLGPVDVLDSDGANVPLRGPMPARLLAVLVASGSAAIAVDDLGAELWSDSEPPADPVAAVRTYVARLRAGLGPDAILTGTGTYTLGPDLSVDANQFTDMVERARRASGSPTAGELWSQAIDLWRGHAFDGHQDLDSIRPEAQRLNELRAEATEAWFDARLANGEGRELVADVENAVEAFPLREGFRAQQMTVMARAGRSPEALRAFQEFRQELTEIGVEPSARLVELDEEIAAGKVPSAGARRTLRGYELGDRLGEGAFAVVYEAAQASVGRKVAIKQIRSSLADQPDFIRQFEAEAHLIARLEHPHIVPLYDYWREPGAAYLVMRHLDGGSLATRLLDSAFDLESTVRVIGQVASALDVAHQAGVVHRDVKPANVLMDTGGNAYLGDFGIAVEEAERLDPSAWLSNGSPAYAAPEQLQRETVGATADVYSLAMTAYELLTRELPFRSETTMAGLIERQLRDPIPLVRSTVPEIPGAVDTVLQKATAKNPADRYETAGAFALELAAAAGLSGDEELLKPQDRNPYKGLAAYGEADAGDFAGRDRLTGALVSRISQQRIVLVVGPSGSGKSSVVHAGVLPAIRAGRAKGSERWLVTSMTPGSDPFASLEDALLRVAVRPPADLLNELQSAERGMGRAVRATVAEGTELLVVIDQFEELFTLGASPTVVENFLGRLVDALTQEDPRLRVLVTLRADFYDHPLNHSAFAQLVNDGTVPVHPLAADELERAIAEPARSVGARFEPGLVAAITADVVDQPGALPLLQYALTELYDDRDGDMLTRGSYERLGGVAGALSRRAEQLYVDLPPAAQADARPIFGRMVSLGEGTEDTRRRAIQSEFSSRLQAEIVLERFGAARLLSFDRDPITREPTVEVAHEALLRQWPRLRSWINEDRDGLRILHHLGTGADGWVTAGRPESELYRGGRLEAANSWVATHRDELSSLEHEFLAASNQRSDNEAEAEQRATRRLRRLAAGMAIVAALALIAGSVAFIQRNDAEAARAEVEIERETAVEARDGEAVARLDAEESEAAAIENAELAETRRLVSDAAVVVEDNPDLALLLAAEAHRRADSPQTLAGLQTVLTRTGPLLGTLGAGEDFLAARWRTNGDVVGLTAEAVVLFDSGSGQELSRTPLPVPLEFAPAPNTRLTVTEDWIAVGLDDGTVILLDGETVETVTVSTVPVSSVALSPSGSQFLAGDHDGKVHLIDTRSGERAWSTDVITASSFEEVVSDEAWPFFGWLDAFAEWTFESGPRDMVFDGETVLVNGGVDLFRLDRATGAIVDEFRPISEFSPGLPPIPRAPGELEVGPNGDIVLSGGSDNIFFVSPDFSSAESLTVPSSTRDVSAGLSGSVVLSTGMVWTVNAVGKLDSGPLDGPWADSSVSSTTLAKASDLDASPDEQELAIAGEGGIVRWAIGGEQLLAEGLKAGSAQATEITPSGGLLYVGTPFDFTAPEAVVYDLTVDAALSPHPDEQIRYFSVDEVGGQEFLIAHVRGEGFAEAAYHVDPRTFALGQPLIDIGGGGGIGYNVEGDLMAAPRLFQPAFRVLSMPDATEVSPTFDLSPWLTEDEQGLSAAAFDPRRPRLVGAAGSAAIVVNTDTWEIERVLTSEEGFKILTVAYAAEADVLVTRDAAGSIERRDPETFAVMRSISGGSTGGVTEGPFLSADGEYLLTTRDEVPRLWHLPSATLLGAFPSDRGRRHGGAAGSDQLRLATLVGKHALMWNLRVEEWPEIACRAAGRNMTSEEWELFGPAGDYQVTCPQWGPG